MKSSRSFKPSENRMSLYSLEYAVELDHTYKRTLNCYKKKTYVSFIAQTILYSVNRNV